VTTGRNTTGVRPDYTSLAFFGEPRLLNQALFPSGVLNPNCAVDLNGDTAFISQTGIHSYNATLQTQIKSNNDPVSIQIHQLLVTNQTYGAAIDFDDYALFAIETIYGPGVVVYDKTLGTEDKGKFIGLDLYRNIGQIKQFAKISTAAGQRLFFITADNRLFEFGAGTTYETTRLYLGDWNGGVAGVSQILRRAHLVFSGVYSDTIVQVSDYVDRRSHNIVAYTLQGASVTSAPTLPVPYRMSQGASNGMVHHENTDASLGFAVGLMIEWASEARLVFARLDVDFESKIPSTLALVPGYQATPFEFAIAGDLAPGVVDSVWTRLGPTYQFIGVGNIGTWSGYTNTLQRLKSRFMAVAGNLDLDLDGGLIFYNQVANGARYYSRIKGNVEFFFYNVGWTTANINTVTGDADGFTLGSTQANWLKGQLAASTATFKVVVLHFPPYSSNTAYVQLQLPFRSWGASLVIAAHDKNYQRHIIDGLNYITVGTGSNSSSALGTPGTGYQTGRTGTAGYLKLIATAFSLKTAHVGIDGTVFDEHIIYP
jgi:Calcineurin-like phosphoesterase.